MTEHSPPIPDDLATCQAQLRAVLEQHAALLQRFHDLECQLDETCATTEELQRSYACLKEEYLALKRLLFGPRRERLPEAPGQGHLFDTEPPTSTPPEPAASDPSEPRAAKRRKGHGRRPIADHLPRRDVLHDVPEEDRTCTCGRAKTKIGEDVTEQLDYIPGKLERAAAYLSQVRVLLLQRRRDHGPDRLWSDRRRPGRTRAPGSCHRQQVRRAHAAVSWGLGSNGTGFYGLGLNVNIDVGGRPKPLAFHLDSHFIGKHLRRETVLRLFDEWVSRDSVLIISVRPNRLRDRGPSAHGFPSAALFIMRAASDMSCLMPSISCWLGTPGCCFLACASKYA